MTNTENPVEHEGRYKEDGWMIDRWACSCGWESEPYFDGAEYAEGEWKRHAVAARTSKENPA